MNGKYDPLNEAELLRKHPHITSTVELMVTAAEAQFSPKMKADEDASRARPAEESPRQPGKRGRKPVVTPKRVQMICDLIAHGETECAACIRAGIGSTAWSLAKRVSPGLREQIDSARDDWARLQHQRHAAAIYESQTVRAAGRKALKPHPTRQANLVVWSLVTRVPLYFAAIPEEEIANACKRCGLSLETWRRQERAFNLVKKVYAKRAKIRGEHLADPTKNFPGFQTEEESTPDDGDWSHYEY